MAALGGVITAAVICVVIWEAAQPAAAPALSVHIAQIEVTSSGHVAVVKVVNQGDDTASAVQIEGVLGEDTATATVDSVPGHGHAKAFLRFDQNPQQATFSVKGWAAP